MLFFQARGSYFGRAVIWRASAFGLILGALAAFACTHEPGYDGCYVEHPAFVVSIRAESGPLPADMDLHVHYGAGDETYTLGKPPQNPDVVFCTEVAADSDAGADAAEAGPSSPDGASDDGGAEGAALAQVPGPVGSLVCELWTQGAATIVIEASGYRRIESTLKAHRDSCGIETHEQAFVLQEPDAGTNAK